MRGKQKEWIEGRFEEDHFPKQPSVFSCSGTHAERNPGLQNEITGQPDVRREDIRLPVFVFRFRRGRNRTG